MKLSPEFIENTLQPYTDSRRIYIAYSGGVDSHVLLHLCAKIQKFSDKLIAVHLNHGLQAEADTWSGHCQQVASQLNIEFILHQLNAQPLAGASPEETARHVRYQVLAKLLKKDDLLLTGQHREDQYETILLQMLRGAGLAGLSGMPEQMTLGKGLLIRPLLIVSKQDIVDYAQQHQLAWVEDTSNWSDNFERNYLRNQISPLIKARWPSADKTISRAGKHCANAGHFIEQMTEALFLSVYCPHQRSLTIEQLLAHDQYRRQLIIRRWFQILNLRMPSTCFIQQLETDVIAAKVDAQPCLLYQNGAVHRYRDRLYWQDNIPAIDYSARLVWPLAQLAIDLPNNGRLALLRTTKSGIAESDWQQAKISIAYRQGGERMRLPGREGHHSLKKLFQEAGIPPWQRVNIPLIFLDGQLAAVADKWVSSEFIQETSGKKLQIQWLHPKSTSMTDC